MGTWNALTRITQRFKIKYLHSDKALVGSAGNEYGSQSWKMGLRVVGLGFGQSYFLGTKFRIALMQFSGFFFDNSISKYYYHRHEEELISGHDMQIY